MREGAGTLKGRQVKSHRVPRPRHWVRVGTKVRRGRARVPFLPASRPKPVQGAAPCPRPSAPLGPAVPSCGRLRKAGNAPLTTHTSMSVPRRRLRPPANTQRHDTPPRLPQSALCTQSPDLRAAGYVGIAALHAGIAALHAGILADQAGTSAQSNCAALFALLDLRLLNLCRQDLAHVFLVWVISEY